MEHRFLQIGDGWGFFTGARNINTYSLWYDLQRQALRFAIADLCRARHRTAHALEK